MHTQLQLHRDLVAHANTLREQSGGNPYNMIDNTIYDLNGQPLTIRTTQEDIDRQFYNSIQTAQTEVTMRFPEFNSFPPSAQQVLVEMQFNMGGGVFSENNWPRLFEAVRNQDWTTASQECERGQLGDDRNNWARDMFLQAAGQ
jgi:GH24 family phage-related lysozyme (muramidase)